jgi:hypothetical protein
VRGRDPIGHPVVNIFSPAALVPEGGEMETRLTLAPGQNGTKKLLAEYRDRLICVRYRYDPVRAVRHKTVELIVETRPWTPRARTARRRPNDMVGVRIAYSESSLRAQIKSAGAIWRPRHRLWEVDWKTVVALGLQSRVVSDGRD